MMTRKQKDLHDYIRAYFAEHGTSPTFDEMKCSQGLRSKSGIYRLIKGLEERGFVRRIPLLARAVELVERESDVDRARREGYAEGYAAGLADFRRPVHDVEASSVEGRL